MKNILNLVLIQIITASFSIHAIAIENIQHQDSMASTQNAGGRSLFGRIDAVVNSAGHGPKGPILEISDDDWHEAMECYFLNVVRIARIVTPLMERQGIGTFVNISTFAAFEPDPAFPTSGAMRASFTQSFSDQYAAKNVRMNNVLPGFIDSLPEKQEFLDRIPMERYGTTDEIAKTAAFLISPAAAYITGQNIRVDGGITRSV